MVCWFLSFWCYFDLVKRVKFGVSVHFLKNTWREWPENLHTDVSWPPSKLVRLWSWSVDFSHFGVILTWWNRSNLGFLGISWRTHWGNGLKFCMLMYPNHRQNWLDYGHSFLIFSCDQAALWMVQSVCLSVRHTFLWSSKSFTLSQPANHLFIKINPLRNMEFIYW